MGHRVDCLVEAFSVCYVFEQKTHLDQEVKERERHVSSCFLSLPVRPHHCSNHKNEPVGVDPYHVCSKHYRPKTIML